MEKRIDAENAHSARWPRLIIFVLLVLVLPAGGAAESVDYFAALRQRLVADGFEPAYVTAVYDRPEVALETRGVALFSGHREARLDYDQYLAKPLIRKAESYLAAHAQTFARAEKNFGVNREIITAIILIESRLGVYTGISNIFNTLSTMAALDDDQAREIIWKQAAGSNSGNREKFDRWADRRSKWAYKELKAFLEYTQAHEIDPLAVTGSYAGAFGIPQFMPSNIKPLARDGNDDGRIDLFDHDDAIFSIAYFLKRHGWEPEINREKKYKVLLRYNHSKYYANTLIEIEKQLKG